MKPLKLIIPSFFLFFFLSIPNIGLAEFPDVLKDNAQYSAILYLQDQGIIKGYEDGTFQPDKLITKAEFYKIAFQTIGFTPKEQSYKTLFQDVPEESWFTPYVNKALELGLIHYKPNAYNFYPQDPVSHIEALRLVLPLKGVPTPYVSTVEPATFNDVNNAYTYKYIVDGAYNAGVYVYNKNNFFIANKSLTRGDAAELLYKAAFYQNIGEIPEISIQLTDPSNYDTSESSLFENPKFPIFLNVWNKIDTQYLNKEDIDENELVYGAINGMVKTLSDPYSKFESPDTAIDLQNSLNGTFEGIGTVLDTYNNQFIIIGIIEDSPAYDAGLKTGDIITKVDNVDITKYTIDELLDAIKGTAGTKVNITVSRGTESKTFTVIREKIVLNTVLLETASIDIPSDIGYISIYQFTGSTINEFETLIANTAEEHPRGLILDLRDNPGGYLQSAYDVLNHFIAKDEIISKIKTANQVFDQKSTGDGELSTLPIVILVNKNTASAAEVVAGALQEKINAKLVGTQTYGKGTVQEVSVFNDGSLLKLSIANWLTPGDVNVDKVGLKPDYMVEESKDDVLGKTDSQLLKAIELLS